MNSKNRAPLIIAIIYAVVLSILIWPDHPRGPGGGFNYDQCKAAISEGSISLNMSISEIRKICGKPESQVSFGSPKRYVLIYSSRDSDQSKRIKMGFNENKRLEALQEYDQQNSGIYYSIGAPEKYHW